MRFSWLKKVEDVGCRIYLVPGSACCAFCKATLRPREPQAFRAGNETLSIQSRPGNQKPTQSANTKASFPRHMTTPCSASRVSISTLSNRRCGAHGGAIVPSARFFGRFDRALLVICRLKWMLAMISLNWISLLMNHALAWQELCTENCCNSDSPQQLRSSVFKHVKPLIL